ncbi:hypothetical protein [Streptomyces sp. NRRL F-5123]|nr:hypothetical protein [Streptomyces sp. NRRL F-5123]
MDLTADTTGVHILTPAAGDGGDRTSFGHADRGTAQLTCAG